MLSNYRVTDVEIAHFTPQLFRMSIVRKVYLTESSSWIQVTFEFVIRLLFADWGCFDSRRNKIINNIIFCLLNMQS